MSRLTAALVAASCLLAGTGYAQEYLSEAKASFIFNGERIKIARDNPEVVRFATRFASSGDACGAPCIAPMQVADGVATFGENDVLEFLVNEVAGNRGLMVDARMPEVRARGYIPGTVSLPFATLEPDNNFKDNILKALGAREFDGTFNFTDARELLVYDNGPSTDDAGKLVKNLLSAGYPVEKIHYYRGGMQVWSVLGFSIEEGTS
ncbi:MAG: rhodanese-like domain-containing protein [Sulfitobacter sp.]